MVQSLPILSLLVWAPILGGLVVLCVGDRMRDSAKLFTLLVSLFALLLSILLYLRFDTTTVLMQFVEYSEWISTFNINYHLGVDGISVPLIMLTAFTHRPGGDRRLGGYRGQAGPSTWPPFSSWKG